MTRKKNCVSHFWFSSRRVPVKSYRCLLGPSHSRRPDSAIKSSMVWNPAVSGRPWKAKAWQVKSRSTYWGDSLTRQNMTKQLHYWTLYKILKLKLQICFVFAFNQSIFKSSFGAKWGTFEKMSHPQDVRTTDRRPTCLIFRLVSPSRLEVSM